MATGIADIKPDLPSPARPVQLGKHSAQMRCPHCSTRVLTIVHSRLCGLLSPSHECPQCHKKISRNKKL